MKKILLILLSGTLLTFIFGLNPQSQKAQELLSFTFASGENLRKVDLKLKEPNFKNVNSQTKSAQLKEIQTFGEKSGAAWTDDVLFRTDDNGESWREISLPRESHETISGVSFVNENTAAVVLADQNNARLSLAKTQDGGNYWVKKALDLPRRDLMEEADLAHASLEFSGELAGQISFRLASSSNFIRQAVYQTVDGGETWSFVSSSAEKNTDDDEKRVTDSGKSGVWRLVRDGKCEGTKNACWQESKIFAADKEITPPQIKELSRVEKQNARLQAEKSVFAQPPGGTTRISLNRGFDKCTAATVAQMQTWWDNSPFYDVNIYFSGRNRGCAQPQLTAAWVDSVTRQGWGLIPTVVGYQSPCTASTTSAKFSTDPAVAEQQGRGEADIAVTDANNFGLTQGTVLYYDMERYDDLSGTGACSTPTKAFLKGWTDRLHELGYISGVYGSPFNANGDWINMPQASQPDIVWLARWNNVMSVWGVAPLPDTYWTNHQRIHQWLGPRNETWGNVTFNIDNNISDAPVAGLAIAKNKRADFDGDGKTDLSVWRPETGVWYVLNSSNSSYSIVNFGLSTDVLTPGDYDGDGKTDLAVWRPSDGTWHLSSHSVYRVFTFGTAGDIPVPADYDGDGRTDLAVFRPSTGVWYIWNSFDSRGTSYTILQFGINGDLPVAGDYDGDGKSDIAVYRPSEGVWHLLQSSGGFASVRWGIASDKPVQADYDGDGKTDMAVYRDGVWYLLQSQAGIYITQFGLADDKPAVGDYDGDGKSDIAVYRPSESVWYVWQSQAGIWITRFGISTDSPVPTAYTP